MSKKGNFILNSIAIGISSNFSGKHQQSDAFIRKSGIDRGEQKTLVRENREMVDRAGFEPRPICSKIGENKKRWYINTIVYGGQGWIRTSVRKPGQIYSLLPLTTRPPVHGVDCERICHKRGLPMANGGLRVNRLSWNRLCL